MEQVDVRALYDTERGVLSPRVFSDQAVYELEMERLFTRSWLFLCPEAQIPKPGDFFVTYMGSDRVIVVRQKDGSVRALLNQCRHRSNELTMEESGNTKMFSCSNHGWAYDLAGNLRSVPHEVDGYRNEIDKSRWGCIQVPQLASYRGLLFGNWDPAAPSFTDYMGDAAWYLDTFCDRFDGGLELVGGVAKWVSQANWKLGAEQFAWDSTHGETTHIAAFMASIPPGMSLEGFGDTAGRQFSSVHGHGCGMFSGARPQDAPILELLVGEGPGGYWRRDSLEEATRRLGATRAGVQTAHMTLFPNFTVVGGMNSIRVWQPTGPAETEIWSWVFVPADASEELKQEWPIATQSSFGAGGIYEADDGGNWSSIQRTLKGAVARRTPLNVQMGLGHLYDDDPDYPGTVAANLYSEGPARGFYERWLELLTLDSWAEIEASTRKRAEARL